MTYQKFIFKNYTFDKSSGQLNLNYSYDNKINFTETYTFDFPIDEYDELAAKRAFEMLFFMAGVSYYKTYLAPEIVVEAGLIDAPIAGFLERTYQQGLGEFFYVNKLDPKTPVNFPVNSDNLLPCDETNRVGQLVGLGGGKDSLVSIEILRHQPKVATWSLGHRKQLEPLVEKVGLTHFWVERVWDKTLLEHNKLGYNGHVPISAIFACVGTVVSILSGYGDAVVSNEQSAGEPNLMYEGVEINHQYSKSPKFEQDYQALLKHLFNDSTRYYSFLRPLSEVHIAKIFSKIAFQKYKSEFSSCNKAFVHSSSSMSWCGQCPKCAFTFLIFTPFINRAELESIFDGKNLLLTPSLKPTYKQLLGIEGTKPLDCVGEIKESRFAMRLAQDVYPELATYEFEIPDSYDYQKISAHFMPEELYAELIKTI